MKRLFKSFIYAFRGFTKTWREEQNLRLQSLFALLVIVLGIYLGLERLEWVAVVLAISLVLLMELVNSAVERITDVLKPRINGYVKEIKDIMAGAVMFSSVVAVVIGILVFLPYFL